MMMPMMMMLCERGERSMTTELIVNSRHPRRQNGCESERERNQTGKKSHSLSCFPPLVISAIAFEFW